MRRSRHTLRQTRDLRTPQPRDPIVFRGGEFIVIEGPHAGLRVRVADHVTTIGRDEESTLPLTLDASVSRLHAVVEWGENRLYVRDRSSTNGTRVNSRPIQGRTALSNLDVIEVGRSVLQLIFDLPDEPPIYELDEDSETNIGATG